MSGKGKGNGKMGGLTFTKQVPNFLAKFGGAPDEGIEGALRRHADRDGELDDRSDAEDEKPQVVEAADLLPKRGKDRTASGRKAELFKSKDATASRFAESAFKRVAEAAMEAAAPEAAGDSANESVGKHVFQTKNVSLKKKRRPSPLDGKVLGAKKIKNAAMLSFTEDDE